MKESNKRILEILSKAVESERFFQQEYSRGASLAEEPEVKEIFLRLVEDEMQHEKILTERYRLLKGEPLVLEPEIEDPPTGLRWEHDITIHTMAEIDAIREKLGQKSPPGGEPAVFCDAQGICFFDLGPDQNVEVLKSLLNARGADGWELVQLDYGRDRLICTWRRQKAR
ncbi:ferritin family protein [Candidatus Zixiibacteriota bacterium]